MIRRWFRSPGPEAFLTGGLLLFGAAAFLFHSYFALGQIFQGVLGWFPFFLTGGLAAFFLLHFVREPEKKEFLFPLALTAAAVSVLFSFCPAEGILAAGGICFLHGFGILLPAAVILAVHGTRAVRSMAAGSLLAVLVCMGKGARLYGGGTDGDTLLPVLILLLAVAGLVRTKSFRYLLPLPVILLSFFCLKYRIPPQSEEKISAEQMELTEQILALQRAEPWENIRFIPGGASSGRRGKEGHDLVYVCRRFFPVSDVSVRTLSPDGFRWLRSLLAPGGVLAVTLPRLEFLPEDEAERFRSQARSAAEEVFPHVHYAGAPLFLLIASEDPEITLDGDILAERLAAAPREKGIVEAPKEVLSIVLPLMVRKKKNVSWDPDAGRQIQRKFLKGRSLPFPPSFRDLPELRYWIFGGFLLLAFAFRYLYAFRPGCRMAAACFRSGWITALPLCFLLSDAGRSLSLKPLLLLVTCALVLSGFLLPRPKGGENRWFPPAAAALVPVFLMLFPGKELLGTLLLFPAAFAARFTVPKGAGPSGFPPWFSGAFVCFLLTQMLLAGGCDWPARGLLLLSLFLP